MEWMAEQSKRNEYNPWFSRLLFLDYFLVVSDPKMVSEILANSEDFPRSYHFDVDKMLFGGDILFAIHGPIWKLHRKIMNPFFATNKQKKNFGIVQELAIKATSKLDHYSATGEVFDLYLVLTALTCDVICRFIFGRDFGCLDGDQHGIQRFYRTVISEASLMHKVPLYAWLPLPQRIRFLTERARVQRFLLSEIARAPADTLAGAVLRSGELTTSELCTEILGLVFAGHDTTASALAFCLGKFLPAAPDAAAAVRAEAAAQPADLARWTPDDARCPAADAAFRETLRLVPPGCAHPVQAAADARVCGQLIRRGTPVLANYHAAYRDPRHFGPDADAFRPARWTDGTVDACARATGLPAARAFAPFLSMSPHACLGRPIAELEAGLLVAAWVRRYDFVPEGPPPKELVGATLCPEHMRVRALRL